VPDAAFQTGEGEALGAELLIALALLAGEVHVHHLREGNDGSFCFRGIGLRLLANK
jgi:hypothetical protein